MSRIFRPYAAAGVVLVGVGVVTATSAVATPADIAVPRDPALTAGSGLMDNLTNIHDATTFQGGNQDDFLNPLSTAFTLDAYHEIIYLNFTGQLPGFDASGFEHLLPFLQFVSSPLSGALIGMLGPMISPVVALLDGKNPVEAFFDGATLNLTPFISLFEKLGFVDLPPGVALTGEDFRFGGLFSPGEVLGGGGNIPFDHAPGGSILNSVGLDITIPNSMVPPGLPGAGEPGSISYDFPGEGVGPQGGLEALVGAIASVIGWPEPPETPNVVTTPDLSDVATLTDILEGNYP